MKSFFFSAVLLLGASFVATTPARADARFFLLITQELPQPSFVEQAAATARSVGGLDSREAAMAKLVAAYPRLFDPAPAGRKAIVKSELEAATAAHYAANFNQAERHFQSTFELVMTYPELLDGDAVFMTRLADGAALRYGNAVASGLDVPEARRQLREFVRRFATLKPTRSDHPPSILEVWDALAAEVAADRGYLMVHVEPLGLERSGTCRLLLNGAEVAQLPLSSQLQVPTGAHMLQVQCGLQRSWLQRITVSGSPVSVRVPVRAMLATRADAASGGLVLTQPDEGDAGALVNAVAASAGFTGAVVARTAPGVVQFGSWARGADGHSVERQGRLSDQAIVEVHDVQARTPDGGDGPGAAPWVVAGVGAAAVVGGVVTKRPVPRRAR